MDKTKKKVLAVSCNGLGNGGVQAVIMDILRNCSDEYTFDIVLFTNEVRHHEKEFLSYGGRIFRILAVSEKFGLPSGLNFYLRPLYFPRMLKKIIKQNGPYEAIHCHNMLEAALSISVAKKLGIPVRIAHAHMTTSSFNLFQRCYINSYREILRTETTHLLACSVETGENLFGKGVNIVVTNNPYNSNRFVFDKYPQVTLSSPALVQIGSFSDRKNQFFSLEVVSEIKKTYPQVKFELIGFDAENILSKMKDKIEELDLGNNVTIHPHDADSPKILSESSGFIFPSKVEPFGIVAVEAQAMGVKCYASDAVPKTTDCGGCEYLPLSAGAAAWAQKIIEDFKATGGKHEKYDCSAFAAQNVAQTYKNIYGGVKS